MLRNQQGTFLSNAYTAGNLADNQVVHTFINDTGKSIYVKRLVLMQTVTTADTFRFDVAYALKTTPNTDVIICENLEFPENTVYVEYNFTEAQKAVAIPDGAVVKIIIRGTGTVKPANLRSCLTIA